MPRARQAGDVDVVVADGDVGDDLQLRPAGIEHRRIDRVGEQADQRVLPWHALQQLIARNRRRARRRDRRRSAASSLAMTMTGACGDEDRSFGLGLALDALVPVALAEAAVIALHGRLDRSTSCRPSARCERILSEADAARRIGAGGATGAGGAGAAPPEMSGDGIAHQRV